MDEDRSQTAVNYRRYYLSCIATEMKCCYRIANSEICVCQNIRYNETSRIKAPLKQFQFQITH